MPRRARAPAQRIVALRRGTPWALTHAPAWMGARAEQSSGGHHHGGGNALMPSLDTASGRWVLVVLLASIQLALLSIASLRREHFRRHRW